MEIERTGTSEVSSGGKLTEESYVRTAELAARRAEAEAKLKAASAPWWGKADALVLAVAAGAFGLAANVWVACDLLPNLPSFIRRVCSGYALVWGVLRTQSV